MKWKLILFVTAMALFSCKQWTVPTELVAEWHSKKSEVSVRIKDENGKYKFIKDSADLYINIYNNNLVNGKIGSANFENAHIIKNGGFPPSITGIAYIIKDIEIAKIFNSDPLEKKSIELWLAPLKGDTLEVELRYTSNHSHFPMSGFTLIKHK